MNWKRFASPAAAVLLIFLVYLAITRWTSRDRRPSLEVTASTVASGVVVGETKSSEATPLTASN